MRLAAEEHLLLLTLHHIVADGWSMGLLVHELSTLYECFVAGTPSPLLPLPIQYPDYALWQRHQMGQAAFEEHLTYWKQQLRGSPPVLALRPDRPRSPVQTFHGVHLSLQISTELSERLRALSLQQETTLFMTLLSAFTVLLSRQSGQEDIVVGTPIAGRTRSEFEPLIGCFLNTLVLRTNLSRSPSFLEVLQRVRTLTLEAYAHQDVPFEHLLQALQVERSLSSTPLFQVFFNMVNVPSTALSLPGLNVETVLPSEVASKFDLTLYVKERQETLLLDLVYNADLFDHGRMAELLEQLHMLLAQVVEHPEEFITRFSLVTATARAVLPNPREVLSTDWYGAIHTHFSLQARRVPDRIAVIDPHSAWSYQELDRRSNQLAHALRTGGIQSQDRVALYGSRNAALICAVLAVLKAGAVFSILDPAYPAARLIDYLQLIRPRGWLQIEEAGPLPNLLEEYLGTLSECVCLPLSSRLDDPAHDLLRGASMEAFQVPIGSDDLASISFTSGSTGKPKGVLGRHGPLTHFLPWQIQRFELRENDHFSMLSGLSHDPLQREIFTPFWLGATLFIPPVEERGTPGQLAAWMEREQISVTHLTPAMIHLLTQSASGRRVANNIPALRHALILGDAVTRGEILQLQQRAPAVICVSTYGSTETQRAVGYFVVPGKGNTSAKYAPNERVPLGRGMKDVQLLVLRDDLQLAGIGEMGEIYVRSPHLARGYLDDEGLTQERFLLNPFTHAEGDRLYRTGDLGCYLPDGAVEFLGRRDNQVKLRGFRIETGEIEETLRRSSAVRDCLVILREEEPGEKRLVAYIIAHRDQPIAAHDLRRLLKIHLPDYMVPAAFVFLEQMPLTPNGKIDRRALPPPERNRRDEQEPVVAARTPVEEILVAIWTQILHLSEIGIHDNFFELGGHSLLATQVVARVRQALQVELPLRALFEAPTVAELAQHIAAAYQEQGSLAPLLRPSSRAGDLPLSFAQQRLWFLDQFDEGCSRYTIPAAMRLQGRLSAAALSQSLSAILQRHEALRTTFPIVEGQPVQRISPTLKVALPVVDVTALTERQQQMQIRQIAREEAETPFDLACGPLLRACLLRVSFEEHVLLLCLHHIVSDGWSLGILLRELSILYQAFLLGQPFTLPQLPLQYADYARWQRECLQGEVLEAQLSYWREHLHGGPAVLELPTDRPRPAALSSRGARYRFTLPQTLAQGLRLLSQQEGVTLFMTLLAAWQTLLLRYSGQDEIVVGTPIANRTYASLEDLIGCFVNTLVLCGDLSGDPDFRTLLGRTREVTLGAYAHQDLPFEQIVEALQPQRNLSHTPLFQVLFVLQNAPMEPIQMAGLRLWPLEIERTTTRFDLALTLQETAGGIEAELEYATDLFEARTIEGMMGHWRTLLERDRRCSPAATFCPACAYPD